jgi:glycosyltransferase involved in cell wall biosynthesis
MSQLLLLTYTFPPDNMAAAARPAHICKYLPEHDYQPIVIASSNEGSLGVQNLVYRVPSGSEPQSVLFLSNFTQWLMRYGAPYHDRLPWAAHAAYAGLRLIESHKVAAIYSTSPFLASHFAALWLKMKFGLPWIADFQDPVRDNPMRNRNWVYPYDSLIENIIFRQADRLIANTDTVAAAWRKRYPQWAAKTSVLWNSFDPRDIIEVSQCPSRPHRVLAHVGGLYGQRHPGLVLSSLERLGISASTLRVKLVGPIDSTILVRQQALFERMQQNGVLEYENRIVPREEARRETAEADYLLLLDLNDSNASLQVPSKLLEYIRFGKPILAYTPTGSPVERILERSGVAYVAVDPATAEASGDQKIREFLGFSTAPRSPSPWFEETLSAETEARTLAGLLNDLLSPKKATGVDGGQ